MFDDKFSLSDMSAFWMFSDWSLQIHSVFLVPTTLFKALIYIDFINQAPSPPVFDQWELLAGDGELG